MINFPELVHKCFSSDGWLASAKGFRNEPAQESYAMDVVAWLTGQADKPVALIEGDTGVGKTLAYLIPLFIFVRLTGLRGVVATHTINLQNQMLETDVGIANEYLESCDLLPCTIQQLIGRQAFIDPYKVEYRLKSLQESGFIVSEAVEIMNEAYRCSSRDGLIESFYLQIGGEPEYLPANDICVDADSDDEVNSGFERQREVAKRADIVITSQTMLLLNRNRFGSSIFENPALPIGAIVIDEADLLESAAEMFSAKRLHPKQLGNSLAKLYEKLTTKEKKIFGEIKHSLAEFDSELRNLNVNRNKSEPILINAMQGASKKSVLDRLAQIESLCNSFGAIAKRQNLDAPMRLARDEFFEICEFVTRFRSATEDEECTCGINWSETLGIPSLQIAQAYPARRIKNYLFSNDGPNCRLMLTSATLSDGREKGFISIKVNIQLLGDKFYSVESSHSPINFGTVDFVLTGSYGALPITMVAEQIVFDSEWLNHVAAIVTEAGRRGNTLVLTGSFAEAEAVASRLRLEKIIHVHRTGINIKTVIADFQSKGGILITPSAWEGVSIRSHSGTQHFTELVITRAPYSPPDKFRELVLRDYLRSKAIGEPKASSIVWAKSVLTTVRKLRQGIGRLIRNFADVGTIWFCDPRIPIYGGVTINKQDNGLIKAIPHRFMESYKNALVFDSSKKILCEHERKNNVPTEIEEWL